MTHRANLGTDLRGNLTRIDNALSQMSQRLEATKAQLDNLYQQQAVAKEEVGKPFLLRQTLSTLCAGTSGHFVPKYRPFLPTKRRYYVRTG